MEKKKITDAQKRDSMDAPFNFNTISVEMDEFTQSYDPGLLI